MRSNRVVSILFLLWGCGNVVASPDLQFVSQSRSVSASNDKGQNDSRSASGFGAFAEEAGVAWECPWEPVESWEPKEYAAGASQSSTLWPEAISAAGSAWERGPFYCLEPHSQDALSEFHVVFLLDAPREFHLTGVLYAWGDYGGTNKPQLSASVELSNGVSSVFSASTPLDPPRYGPQLYLDETLALSAGIYVLDISASAHSYYTPDDPWPGVGGGGEARYGIQLVAIPAPGVVPLTLWGLSVLALLRRRILT